MPWHPARSKEDLLDVVERSHQNKEKTNEWKQGINKNKNLLYMYLHTHNVTFMSVPLEWMVFPQYFQWSSGSTTIPCKHWPLFLQSYVGLKTD